MTSKHHPSCRRSGLNCLASFDKQFRLTTTDFYRKRALWFFCQRMVCIQYSRFALGTGFQPWSENSHLSVSLAAMDARTIICQREHKPLGQSQSSWLYQRQRERSAEYSLLYFRARLASTSRRISYNRSGNERGFMYASSPARQPPIWHSPEPALRCSIFCAILMILLPVLLGYWNDTAHPPPKSFLLQPSVSDFGLSPSSKLRQLGLLFIFDQIRRCPNAVLQQPFF